MEDGRWSQLPHDGRFDVIGLGETSWSSPFVFAQLADTQLGLLHLNKSWEEELESMRGAMRLLNSIKPKFAIICGDLVNYVPEIYPDEDPETWTRQIEAFKRCVSDELNPEIPLVCVCGNHDVSDHPTPTTIARYRKEFGDDYFSFWAGGMCGVVLNSSLYFDPSLAEENYAEQCAWLDAILREASQRLRREEGCDVPLSSRLVVFTHHPLFLVDAEEEDDAGTTTFELRGTSITMENRYFRIPKARRWPLLRTLAKHGVEWVFSGHWHRCGGGVAKVSLHVEGKSAGSTPVRQVITGATGTALGPEGNGLRLVRVGPSLTHKYFEFQWEDMNAQVSSFLADKRQPGPAPTKRPLETPVEGSSRLTKDSGSSCKKAHTPSGREK